MVLVSAVVLVSSAAAGDVKVTYIEVQGNKRIEASTILAKIRTKEGDLFSPSKVRDDIAVLYQLGHFEDIQVKTEGFEQGLKVIFVVKEKPLIREISYEGNQELSLEKIKEAVTLLPRTAYNSQLLLENAEKIRLKYQDEGYYNTVVVPVVKELRNGDRNVVFSIEEGKKIRLAEVIISGNKVLSSKEIKKALKNQEHWFFSFMGRSGVLRTEELREDAEIIRDLYYNRGYIQVQVDEPVIEKRSDDELALRFTVREGEQFSVRSLEINGNRSLSGPDLREAMKLKPGSVFSRADLRRDISAIMEKYDNIARPFANVVPRFDIDPEHRSVAIAIDIQEGGEVRIGRINISGNVKTRDKVIRREFRLDEGDLYSKKAIRRTYERLNNLNFFESVDIAPEQKLKEPVMDLNVNVKEKLTGTMSIGGGYSSVDGMIGIAEISQGNLFGRGQLLKLKLQWGGTHDTLVASFREPYLFDRPVWGNIDVYNQTQEYDGYTLKTQGFGLAVGKSFTEYTSASLRYSWDKSEVIELDEAKILPGSALDQQLEYYGPLVRTSAVSTTLARDSRDFYLDPRRGSRNSLFLQYAGGGLGGDTDFSKEVLDSAWYFPLFWDTVFMARGRVGFVRAFGDKPLPLGERFFVGGSNTVRGFKYGTVGPQEPIYSYDGTTDPVTGLPNRTVVGYNRLGGDKELIFNFEFTFPVVPEARIRGVFFYDIGSAFGPRTYEYIQGSPPNQSYVTAMQNEHLSLRELRHSVGWGFRWLSPIGPLRFEWGYIINRKPEDEASQFEFSIGSLF